MADETLRADLPVNSLHATLQSLRAAVDQFATIARTIDGTAPAHNDALTIMDEPVIELLQDVDFAGCAVLLRDAYLHLRLLGA